MLLTPARIIFDLTLDFNSHPEKTRFLTFKPAFIGGLGVLKKIAIYILFAVGKFLVFDKKKTFFRKKIFFRRLP